MGQISSRTDKAILEWDTKENEHLSKSKKSISHAKQKVFLANSISHTKQNVFLKQSKRYFSNKARSITDTKQKVFIYEDSHTRKNAIAQKIRQLHIVGFVLEGFFCLHNVPFSTLMADYDHFLYASTAFNWLTWSIMSAGPEKSKFWTPAPQIGT